MQGDRHKCQKCQQHADDHDDGGEPERVLALLECPATGAGHALTLAQPPGRGLFARQDPLASDCPPSGLWGLT